MSGLDQQQISGPRTWNSRLNHKQGEVAERAGQTYKQEMAIAVARTFMRQMGISEIKAKEPQRTSTAQSPGFRRREVERTKALALAAFSDGDYELPSGSFYFEEEKTYDRQSSVLSRHGIGKTPRPIAGAIHIIHSAWSLGSDARNPVVATIGTVYPHYTYIDRFCIWLEEIADQHDLPLPPLEPPRLSRV